MGRAKNLLATGKVGNLIFYEYRGQQCCRTAPGTVKQTAGMKKNSSRFGLAACASGYLRSYLEPIFHDAKDKTMLYGFNSAINKWLREFQPNENTFSTSNFYIDNFQFNQQALLPVLVKKPINARFTGSGAITIDVPELMPGTDIIAPPNTVHIHYKARVTGCVLDFNRNYCFHVHHNRDDKRNDRITLEYGEQPLPPQSISLQIQPMQRALIVVVFGLQYEVRQGKKTALLTDKSWLPVGVVGSCFGMRSTENNA